MSVSFAVKPIDTDTFKVALAIPPEKPAMRGHITVHAKIRSKAELKEFGDAIADGEYEDDIEALKAMYTKIEGLGKGEEAIDGDAVWDFLQNDKVGSYIVPALIHAYFSQYQSARRGNSKGRRSR